MASKFSAAVRAGLLLKGVNQSALASKLGVSENTVSRWVQDKCLPDRESILHLKDFFQWEESRLTRLLEDWYENGGGEIGYRVAGPEYVKWRYGGDYLAFLDDIIRLDHETIDDLEPLDVGTSAQWAPVFKSGTECWRLILHRDEIIGYWQFVFLKEKFFAGFLRGELRDSMLTLDMLDYPAFPGDYFGYVVMFALRKDHQKSRAFDSLMKSLSDTVAELAKNDRYFKAISAQAFTKLDEKLCEALGMQRDGEIHTGSGAAAGIYLLNGQDITQSYFARNNVVARKYRERFG